VTSSGRRPNRRQRIDIQDVGRRCLRRTESRRIIRRRRGRPFSDAAAAAAAAETETEITLPKGDIRPTSSEPGIQRTTASKSTDVAGRAARMSDRSWPPI
jgi:hypothetical protein